METEEQRKAILAKLMLLGEVRKLHEWTAFGQKEAEEFEAAEDELDSRASGSATD